MKKHILAAIAVVLIFALALAGCGKTQQPEVTAPVAEATPTEDPTETTAATEPSTEPEETEPQPKDCVVVQTPFGNLQYQDQWIEFMRTDVTDDGNTVTVIFYSEINSVRYELFGLIIGEGDGGLAGQITGPDGVARNVYVRMLELGETDTLSDGEQNRLFAMQEEINYVIDNLK